MEFIFDRVFALIYTEKKKEKAICDINSLLLHVIGSYCKIDSTWAFDVLPNGLGPTTIFDIY